MPSEPDNKMDDLLRSYAKKRRDEAGAAFELHPATRKLLQTEAARLRPKNPERKESGFSALLAFWPRSALAATVFVVLGIGAWISFRFAEQPERMARLDSEQNVPRPERARSPAISEKKESGARQFREAVGGERESFQRPASGPVPAEPQFALREEAVVRLKTVADESKVKRDIKKLAENEALQKDLALPPPAPTAASESAATRRLAAADAKDKGASAGIQPAENYSKLPQLQADSAGTKPQNALSFRAIEADPLTRQNTPAPAAPPAPPSPVAANAVSSTGVPSQTAAAASAVRFYSTPGQMAQSGRNATQSRNRFSQIQSISQATLPGQAGAAAPVLAEFDFEQTGNRVRVVDADGSVYDGLIEDSAKTGDYTKEPARRDALQNVEVRKAPAKPAALADLTPVEHSAWNFRASGTNRTLQQAVTINGVFYANSTNLGGPAAQTRGASRTTPQQVNATLPPAQRIQGRIQVGSGAETQLDAVRRGN